MSIRQNGGVFGRNPKFNNIEVDGEITVKGQPLPAGDNLAKLDVAQTFTAPQEFTSDTTISAGNLVIGAAGKGIAFNAEPSTTKNNVLSDYEEGDWFLYDQSGGLLVLNAIYSNYTKVGRLVYVQFYVTYPTNSSPYTAAISLPFAPKGYGQLNIMTSAPVAASWHCTTNAPIARLFRMAGATAVQNAELSGHYVFASGCYQV